MIVPNSSQEKSDDLLMEYSNIMHVWLMKIIAIYNILYTFVNIYLGDVIQGHTTAISLPLIITSYFLFNKGFVFTSKVFNVAQILTIITVLSVLSGVFSLMYLYYLPLIDLFHPLLSNH